MTTSQQEPDAPAAGKQPTEPTVPATPFYIVGIGASAGGLEALERFFRNVPPDSGAAYIVVQHLSPDFKSLMVELLAKHTSMEVTRADHGMEVRPNTAYLIPPKKNLTIANGQIVLHEQEPHHGLNLPIDIFFRSLAKEARERSVGIVLSGTGSDGMRGVRAIKEAGGLVLAQEPGSAKFDGMPRSAINTGIVDHVLAPEAMPETLGNFIRHAGRTTGDETPPIDSDQSEYGMVLEVLSRQTGIDFSFYKPATITRRIARRMTLVGIEQLSAYLTHLQTTPREVTALQKDLLIGVTSFFRDTDGFEALWTRALPAIFDRVPPGGSIRAWTAGCSTGEEAYSLAMLFQQMVEERGQGYDIKIFATDVDRDAIEFASAGVYPESIAADISPERLSRFFLRKGDSYQIARPIRESVIFATQNILRDPPFTKIDLLTCRNLLIYLQPILQKRVLSLFDFALNADGFLFLGSSETVGDLADRFQVVDSKWKIYRSRHGGRPALRDALTMPPVQDRLHARREAHSRTHATPARMDLQQIQDALLKEFVPPCVAVDEGQDLLHVFGDVSRFIRIPPGAVTFNLSKLIHKDFSIALGSAVQKALREGKEIHYHDLRLKATDPQTVFRLRVKPLPGTEETGPLALIFFEEEEARRSETPAETVDVSEESQQRIHDLEHDLQHTRESLQATIEELETSNEELQATNEELLSSNEELQSTNEELQSVNEELYTVNAEYQNKIQELTELNNDIDNLLRSSEIGTLFLDADLNIRKFTPAAAKVVNVIQQDIGRPIIHLSHHIHGVDLVEEARRVLLTLSRTEKEVRAGPDQWCLMRVLPYWAEGVVGKGVVITFVDITALKRAEKSRDRLSSIVESTEDAIIGKDLEGQIVAWNRGATQTYGWSAEEAVGEPVSMIVPPDRRNEIREILDRVQKEKRFTLQTERLHRDGRRIPVLLTVSPFRDENGEVAGASVIAHDISGQLEAATLLQREKGLMERVMEVSPAGITVLNPKGEIVFANRLAETILGLTRDMITARTYKDPAWRITAPDGAPFPEDELPFSRVMETGEPAMDVRHAIEWPNGRRVLLNASCAPLKNENGEIQSVVATVQVVDECTGPI